ncbi:N-acetylmuramidase domain-containing protein [Sphingomonas sp. BK580]|uniref:N-acetylmuramidase domain-containing protein n=1 Tax=Sphingomonas sp. BK580 TaxID=2586972 RepID=UPI001607A687|nr:N-acetylmuramidase domain-containing protein [Sphingomonas sp. BK580]MBB3693567.1 hypothetical protein [Sphingomonas sp. BK580]
MKDIFDGSGLPLSQSGVDAFIAEAGGVEPALWALIGVETRGFGFLPDRRPKILFERHVFNGRTGGRYRHSHPDLSDPKPGGYLGGAAEYQRLKRAMLLDRRAALESASWGLGQVMGFNARRAGYSDVEAIIDAFAESEDAQLLGCAKFISTRTDLRRAYQGQDWRTVAFFYNGSDYAKHGYDKKLKATFGAFAEGGSLPSVAIRQIQAYLTYLGYNPRGIDGVVGAGTSSALSLFRKDRRSAGETLPDFDSAQPGVYLGPLCKGCGHDYGDQGEITLRS